MSSDSSQIGSKAELSTGFILYAVAPILVGFSTFHILDYSSDLASRFSFTKPLLLSTTPSCIHYQDILDQSSQRQVRSPTPGHLYEGSFLSGYDNCMSTISLKLSGSVLENYHLLILRHGMISTATALGVETWSTI